MAHGDAQEGNWRGNWRMELVASTLHTTSEHGVSTITTADAHTSAASSRLNWRPRRFKWTHPFRRNTKSDFCTCDITFQLASTSDCRWGKAAGLWICPHPFGVRCKNAWSSFLLSPLQLLVWSSFKHKSQFNCILYEFTFNTIFFPTVIFSSCFCSFRSPPAPTEQKYKHAVLFL